MQTKALVTVGQCNCGDWINIGLKTCTDCVKQILHENLNLVEKSSDRLFRVFNTCTSYNRCVLLKIFKQLTASSFLLCV